MDLKKTISNGYNHLNKEELIRELMIMSTVGYDDASIEYSDTGVYSLDTIMSAVCRVHGVDKEFVIKRTRERDNLTVRQEFYYFATKFSGSSLKTIGKYAGGYNHATVLHGKGVIQDLLDSPGSHQLKNDIDYIFHKLRLS